MCLFGARGYRNDHTYAFSLINGCCQFCIILYFCLRGKQNHKTLTLESLKPCNTIKLLTFQNTRL